MIQEIRPTSKDYFMSGFYSPTAFPYVLDDLDKDTKPLPKKLENMVENCRINEKLIDSDQRNLNAIKIGNQIAGVIIGGLIAAPFLYYHMYRSITN